GQQPTGTDPLDDERKPNPETGARDEAKIAKAGDAGAKAADAVADTGRKLFATTSQPWEPPVFEVPDPDPIGVGNATRLLGAVAAEAKRRSRQNPPAEPS